MFHKDMFHNSSIVFRAWCAGRAESMSVSGSGTKTARVDARAPRTKSQWISRAPTTFESWPSACRHASNLLRPRLICLANSLKFLFHCVLCLLKLYFPSRTKHHYKVPKVLWVLSVSDDGVEPMSDTGNKKPTEP